MFPVAFYSNAGVDLDNDASSSGSGSGSGREEKGVSSESRSVMDGWHSSSILPSPIPRNYISLDGELIFQLLRDICSTSANGESGSGSRSSSCESVLREQTYGGVSDGDTNGRRDWGGGGTLDTERDLEDEESMDLGDAEDKAYTARRRLRREGKRPTVLAQRIFSGEKRTGRRRFRDTDASSINQLDNASGSSPIPQHSTRHLLDALPSPSPPTATRTLSSPLSTPRTHLSSHPPASVSVHAPIISSDPAHDDVLTSVNPTSATASPSSTATNTVGVVRHISSPIPIVAGTLAGIIALLAAVVVTIVVTRKNSAERARVRSRRSWLQQQQQGGGDGSWGIGLSVGVARVPSRSAGSVRSSDGRRGERARDKAKQRSRRRPRSSSSSNETVSTDDDDDRQEVRRGPASSFGGAVDFGARGSFARCFDIPPHLETRSTKSSSGKVRKKPPGSATVNEDVSKLQGDVEMGYNDEPHALDSPYIELHIRHHKSHNYSTKDRQPPSSAVYHYPPSASAYGTMSSAFSSLSNPPVPPGPQHLHQSQQSHLLHGHGRLSPSLSLRPGHLTEQSNSSISCSSSPLPRLSPPPLHGPQGVFTGSTSTDVKDPNGFPDAAVTNIHNQNLEDLPPAYGAM